MRVKEKENMGHVDTYRYEETILRSVDCVSFVFIVVSSVAFFLSF